MKTSKVLIIIGLIGVVIVTSAWLLCLQTRNKILVAYRISRETEAKVINGVYENYIDNLNRNVYAAAEQLSLAANEQPQFEEWTNYVATSPNIKKLFLRAWWLSPDGKVLYATSKDQLFTEDFASDPMFSSAEEGVVYSDLYTGNKTVYLRTICPVVLQDQHYLLVIDTRFGTNFVNSVRKLVEEDVAFLYGYKIFAASSPRLLSTNFQIPIKFLNSVRDKQEAGSQTVELAGVKYLITAYPVLDFDAWDTKGYIVLILPESTLMSIVHNIWKQILLGIGFSLLLLTLVICYLTQRVAKVLINNGHKVANTGFKLRMWLIAFVAIIPVIGVLVYVSFVPVPTIMAKFNSARIRISSQEMANVVSKQAALLTQEYALEPNEASSPQQVLKLIMAEGGFDFAVLDQKGKITTVGSLPTSYLHLKADISRISNNTPQLVAGKHCALFLAKELFSTGTLIYGYVITKDWLRKFEDRANADLTIFIDGKPMVSTVETWTLRTLKLLSGATWRGKILLTKGKLRDIYHDIALIPLTQSAKPQKFESVLMLSVDDTPFQNNITSYHFTVFALILIILSIFSLSIFVMLNVDRPRLLRSVFVGYTFLSPSLIHLFWWAVGPLLFAAYLAFHHWSIINPAKPFVGFGNFIELMHDNIFWHSMLNTVIYTLQVPIGMALSLAIALAVNRKVRGIRVLRTVYYLPAVSSLVVTSIMWRWIYNPDFGILNYLLGLLGIPKLPWLTSPYMAMPAIMIMSIWMVMGQQMIIFLAGLQSIPPEYYDAAGVDGANAFQRFWYITLPLLKPTTFFVLVTSVISSFQVFTPIYVLTQGGPVRSTDVAVYHIWQTAWQELRMGYAAAESWVLFGVILVFTLIEFKLLGKEIKYV